MIKHVKQKHYIEPEPKPIRQSFKRLYKTFKLIRQHKTVWVFIMAYFLYIDGVDTIIKMCVPYAQDVLGLDANSKLTNTSTSALRNNIAMYLANYKMLNDYIQISNGKIVNLGFEVDLYIDKRQPQSQIISQVITSVQEFMDINKYQMGDNIYMSSLIEIINNVGGVLNVIDLRAYNKVGEGLYSLNEISQPYLDDETRQIDLTTDFTLFGESTTMFEIKFPNIDIKVRVK
jgi:hypothetical protein